MQCSGERVSPAPLGWYCIVLVTTEIQSLLVGLPPGQVGEGGAGGDPDLAAGEGQLSDWLIFRTTMERYNATLDFIFTSIHHILSMDGGMTILYVDSQILLILKRICRCVDFNALV